MFGYGKSGEREPCMISDFRPYQWMVSRLAIMMGGRVAEEMKFGKDHITAGASSDIEQATKLARNMVTRWGLSPKLGTVAYGENQDEIFLGHSVARQHNVSEETARLIDSEIKRLIDEAYDTATKLLMEKKKDWTALAEALLEYETLSGSEIQDIIDGKKITRLDIENSNSEDEKSFVPKVHKNDK